MSDNGAGDFAQRLNRKVAAHQRERAHAARDLFGTPADELAPVPDLVAMDSFDEATQAYDEWVDRRLAVWRGDVILEPELTERPGRAFVPQGAGKRGRVQPIGRLEEMDDLVIDSFAFQEFLTVAIDNRAPMTACTTLESFGETLKPFLAGYEDRFAEWCAQVERAPGREVRGNPLSRLAIHVPWQGTYINGWQMTKGQPDALDGAMQRPATLCRAVEAVGAERWGFGFIERYSAWGQGLHQMGLDAPILTGRLGLPLVGDGSASASQAARTAALAEGAMFTTTGWSLWVGEYLSRRSRSDPALDGDDCQQPFRLTQLWDALKRLFRIVPLSTWTQLLGIPILGIDQIVHAIAEIIGLILSNSDLDTRMVIARVRRMQRLALGLEEEARQRVGFSLHDAFSRMLIGNIEAKLGVMPVPYAVLMAANVEFDPQSDADEIRSWLDSDARQNIDARLVMLSRMDSSVKHNVSTVVSAAVHGLGLRPPEGLEWT